MEREMDMRIGKGESEEGDRGAGKDREGEEGNGREREGKWRIGLVWGGGALRRGVEEGIGKGRLWKRMRQRNVRVM